MSLVRNQLMQLLQKAIEAVSGGSGQLPPDSFQLELDIPKIAEHGDYATNVAMILTRHLRRSPREIAGQIVGNLEDREGLLRKVEIAGPGFINFFVSPGAWHAIVLEILRDPQAYGRQNMGLDRKVQVEFVSANPTGPLHIGHGRGAATGDVVANILQACGYAVQREYYINDAGNQMDTLGRSLYYRYQQLLGRQVEFPENHYKGEYMMDLARDFRKDFGDLYRDKALDDVLDHFTRFASDRILEGIRDDLNTFGVHFDAWFSERCMHEAGAIGKTIQELKSLGHVYEEDGATWFRSTAFGDEKDRVVIRANGMSTYFAADLAYHRNKFERGFETLVDIWGADHHGYVERMLAGVQALGRERSDLKIILVQLVNLLRGGEPVAMSTRAGEFVTLKEVVDEVGRDAARFLFLTRRSDSPLDFDLEVAKMQSNDNPVFYVQYAHARLCSIFEVARERGVHWESAGANSLPYLHRLDVPQELELMRLLGEYPNLLANCVRCLEAHFIPYYLHELVSLFHSYYNQNRILGDDPELTQARLSLAAAIRQVLKNALDLLGVSAPEKM